MSKRRLVITAVLAGQSQSEVARTYGVSQGWISKLMTRYRLEGEAAFEPLSRARKTYENATPPETVELVLRLRKQLDDAGLDAGADTIGWHLTHHHSTTLSRATINRILTRAGAVTPEPKKRPKNSYIRFEATQPNQTWQSDFTHYRLQDGTRHLTHRGGIRRIEDGTDVEILTWLDDCSRYALSVTAHQPVTGPVVLATFRTTTATPSPSCRPCSMSSSRSTTPAGPTGTCRTARRRPPSTPRCPRPPRARTAAQTPTTASATTRSTRPAASPCG